MLVTLGARVPTGGDAIDDFLACHTRIRRFLTLAARLAEHPDPEAAAAVHRYFTVALPLHAEDEDLSLAPRLSGASREIDDTLALMSIEHRKIDLLLAELVPRWSQPTTPPLLAAGAAQLAALFAPHLDREERILFPAARRLLAPADLATLREELRARRAVTP
jgi:hypothetical protein